MKHIKKMVVSATVGCSIMAVLLLSAFQNRVEAAHHWVWSNGVIDVYVDTASINWNRNGEYVEANAYDVAKSDGNARINRFAFFTKSGNWFYKHRDKSWDKSYYEVSHRDETGYVLDYLKKFAD